MYFYVCFRFHRLVFKHICANCEIPQFLQRSFKTKPAKHRKIKNKQNIIEIVTSCPFCPYWQINTKDEGMALFFCKNNACEKPSCFIWYLFFCFFVFACMVTLFWHCFASFFLYYRQLLSLALVIVCGCYLLPFQKKKNKKKKTVWQKSKRTQLKIFHKTK